MCHRTKTKKDSVLEMPASCRAAADKMEQALREEDAASYTPAALNEAAKSVLAHAERDLCRELRKDIVLVAYEAN